MPQFDTSFFAGQIFWMMISFGFLYLMMSQIICPLLDEIIKKRENLIQSNLETAEKLNQQAENLHQRQQAYQLSLEHDKDVRVQQAYQTIQKEIGVLENKHEIALRRKIRKTEQKIEDDARLLARESKKLSTDLANRLVNRLVMTGAKK